MTSLLYLLTLIDRFVVCGCRLCALWARCSPAPGSPAAGGPAPAAAAAAAALALFAGAPCVMCVDRQAMPSVATPARYWPATGHGRPPGRDWLRPSCGCSWCRCQPAPPPWAPPKMGAGPSRRWRPCPHLNRVPLSVTVRRWRPRAGGRNSTGPRCPVMPATLPESVGAAGCQRPAVITCNVAGDGSATTVPRVTRLQGRNRGLYGDLSLIGSLTALESLELGGTHLTDVSR